MDSLSIGTLLPYITLDWIIIGALVALVGIDSLRSGSRRAVALALAFPVAAFLFLHVNKALWIGTLVSSSSATVQGAALLGLTIVLYLAFGRFTESYDGGSLLHAVLVGVATTSIVVASWLAVPILQELWRPNTLITAVAGEAYRFWLILGSLVILAILRK